VRVAAYYLPLHMPAQFAADRINMRRAWDLALQQGLAEELSDMVRGMAMFSFTQGVPPPAMIRQAINTLKECGLPDTAGPMLRLRLAELWANPFYQSNLRRERDRFLAFIPLAEANGDPELRLWSFDALRGFCSELQEVEQAHAWAAKARQAALEIGDEILIKTMEVIELWDRTSLGEQNVQILRRFKELLAYFEPETPDLFVCYAILAALGEQSRAAKAYEEALEYHKRAMNIAKRWQDLGWISWMNFGLAQTYVQMGLLPEAGLVLLDILDWHLALGQLWQTLGCLFGIARRFTQILGHNMDAVGILSMIYHHPETVPYIRTQIDQARSKFEEEMGEVSFSEAWDRGQALDFESAVAQVREVLARAA
jgi:tetratricopeptide (TPR) repeat protein